MSCSSAAAAGWAVAVMHEQQGMQAESTNGLLRWHEFADTEAPDCRLVAHPKPTRENSIGSSPQASPGQVFNSRCRTSQRISQEP